MSLLMLPEQPDVAWATLNPTAGEGGSAAYIIDASGLSLRNRMMYRSLIPNGGSPAMKTRIRLKSTLQTGNPSFEGLAVRHRGFKLTGAVPSRTDTQVWDSDPASKGSRAWYSEQSGTFTDAVFVEPVPEGLGIDYITFELIVRASSGQVTISNVECRNHYAIPYNMDMAGTQLWTDGYSIEYMSLGIDGDVNYRRWVRYVRTEQIPIKQGKLINVYLKGEVTGQALQSNSSNSSFKFLDGDAGVMFKMRRVNDPNIYDFYTIAQQNIGITSRPTVYLDTSMQLKVETDYSQVEVLIWAAPKGRLDSANGFDGFGIFKLGMQDIELEMIVADYISATQ